MQAEGRSLAAILGPVLTIAILLFVLGLAPHLASAAGGEIRVVETRHEVNYPSGVEVSAKIESEADIKEVRVFYRALGSRKWGYAYADFHPGSQVVATQSIPVRESTYIAPGADVEYFFEIRDTEGNVFRTDSAVVEYLDQSFDWRRVQIGPLELVFHDISDSRIEEAARLIRADLRRVEELLHLDQPPRMKGVIYNNYGDANAAFPVQSQTTTDHGTFAGYAFPEQGVFVGQGLDRRIIVHESAHLMIREALGNRVVEFPDWLNEGFATYTEPNTRIRESSRLYGRTPHLKAMKSLSGTPETIPLFYQKSVSVVSHLIEDYGEVKFRLLLDQVASGKTIEVALINVYGFDLHGLDNSWAGLPIPEPLRPTTEVGQTERQDPTQDSGADEPGASVDTDPEIPSTSPVSSAPESSSTPVVASSQRRAPQQLDPTPVPLPQRQSREEPSPFVFIDVWVLAGVAILAATVVGFRFLYNRLRRREETSLDSWQDWQEQDPDRR